MTDQPAPAPIEVSGSIELDYSVDLSGWQAAFEYARMMTLPPPPLPLPVREKAPTDRWPFDPPYTGADVPQLDRLHDYVGLGPQWRVSERRAELLAELEAATVLACPDCPSVGGACQTCPRGHDRGPAIIAAAVDQLLARVDPDPIVCPECAAGKCGNCDGTAWDHERDIPTACLCMLHR